MSSKVKISGRENEIVKLHQFHLKMLSKLATGAIGLSSGEEIFKLIGKQLGELIPESIIITVLLDHENETLIPKIVSGLGNSLSKVTEILGIHPEKMTLSSKKLDVEGLSTGNLLNIEGGLIELTRRLIPEKDCRTLEKMLDINEIYQIGCAWKGTLYGVVVIVTTGKNKLENKEMVQTYMNLASVALLQTVTQEAFSANEVLYQNLYDYAPDMYFSVLPNGNVKSVNLFGATYLGYTKEELIGESVWKVVHPDDLKRVQNQISGLLKNRDEIMELEFRKIRKDGSDLVVQERIQLILDDKENPIEIRIICRDVTENKKFENDLIDRESQIRTILKYSPVPQIIENFEGSKLFVEELIDQGISDIKLYLKQNPDKLKKCRDKATIIEVNNAFLILFKAENQSALQQNVQKYITQQSSEMFIEGLLRLIDGEDSYAVETVYRDQNGSFVEAITRWAVVPGHKDSLDMIVVSMEDMTERNIASKQLQILSNAVDNSPVSILITNAAGLIQYVNPKFQEITGYENSDVVAKESNDVSFALVPDLIFEDLLAHVQKEKVWSGEFQNKRKNGELYWEFASISAVWNEDGRVDHVIALKEDISERKKAEKDLIEAKIRAEESDSLKSAFLANMSHEIRTPMNAIVGFTDLLKNPDLPSEERHEFSNILTSSCETLSAIIDDIVDIAKIEAGQTKIKYSDCHVDEIMQELFTFYSEEIRNRDKRIELKIENSFHEILITDRSRLIQILSNLLGNALKFTTKGFIKYGCYPVDKEMVEFFVSDSGIGIPENMHNLIFDRFRQIDNSTSRKHGGTGLGLAISKNLVEILGGVIWVESNPGNGTTFFFRLPCKPDTDEPINSDPYLKVAKHSLRWHDKTILVVEDNHANWEFFKATLSKTGATLLRAPSGKEAIRYVKSNKPIHIVLMDIQMPDMSGYEVTKIIKKLKSDLPIIAQTAYAMPRDREKSLAAGCDDYMSKPIKPDELLSMVKKYF